MKIALIHENELIRAGWKGGVLFKVLAVDHQPEVFSLEEWASASANQYDLVCAHTDCLNSLQKESNSSYKVIALIDVQPSTNMNLVDLVRERCDGVAYSIQWRSVVDAIETVKRGEKAFPQTEAMKILSRKEYEVAKRIKAGKKRSDILVELDIKEGTMSTHQKKICEKLGLKGIKQLSSPDIYI